MALLTPARPQDGPPHPVPRRPPPRPGMVLVVTLLLGLLLAAIWSVVELQINLASMIDSVGLARDFLARALPLDFPPVGEIVAMTAETLAIVVCATVLGVVISVPVALMAAWNTTTGRIGRAAARVIIVLARAVPDLILAIIFFRLFGLGAIPGILAMGLHSVGMVGKFYADAIEVLDEGPREALRAAGATRWQQITGAVLPPLFPQLVATALHRFDINLRTSVLLGYVGVGGIGREIATALRTLNYDRGLALALLVLLLCIAVELVSGTIRAALLNRSGPRQSLLQRLWDRPGRFPVAGPTGPVSPPWNAERLTRTFWTVVTTGVVLASVVGLQLSPSTLVTGLVNLPQTLQLFLPPGTGGIGDRLLAETLVTLQIALAATLLGAIMALPLGVLAARNVVGNVAVANVFRTIIVIVRGIPELIIAIIFVVITGLGGVAGALALAVGACGLLSKLVADSLEETDVDVQLAVRAGGAGPVQVFFAATLRQAAPAFVAHILYQLDVNIRSATLLGIVGAGGVGYYLLNASRVQQFDVVTTIVIIVLAVVLVVEGIAVLARRVVR